MDKLKQWVALTIVGVLAVLAAGWFLVVSPKRGEAADLRATAEAQRSTNVGLEAKLATLKSQAKDLPKQQAALAAVAAKIPDNPALPALIRALTAAASDTGVELVSLTPSEATAVATVATAGPKTLAKASTDAAKSAGSTSSKPKPKPLAGSADADAAALGSAMAGTLQQIPLAINVVGGYFQIEQFFDRLENLSRAVKVVNVTMTPGLSPMKKADESGPTLASGRSLTGVVNAMVYMSSGRVTTAVPAPVAGK